VWTVTLADLRMRSRQFAVAVLGATLVFAMALVLAGLSGGFRAEASRTVDSVGADTFVVRAGAGGAFTSPAAIDGRLLAEVRAADGVRAADPLVVSPNQSLRSDRPDVFVHLVGVVPGGLGDPSAGDGAGLSGPDDALVDRLTGVRVGETFTIGGRQFHAVGRLQGHTYLGGTPSVYVPIDAARDVVFRGSDDMTAIAVAGRPATVPDGLAVMTTDATRADILVPLHNGIGTIDAIRDFLAVVAIVIIAAVVYLSALERRRDFAVLKAIGSSTGWLFGGIAVQATVVALVSAGLALAVEPLIAHAVPMQLDVPGWARLALPPAAVGIGLLASLSALRQVIRADPALAFGGPG
jgi:putative ABC transport system permease protein